MLPATLPYRITPSDAALSITECSTYEITQSPIAGTIITDTTTVTITVTDEYGNTVTCNFEVNTIDNINPIINTCVVDKDVVLNAACNFTLPDYTSDADLSITECSTYEITQSPIAGTIISDTTTVTITVTDEYGNTATCNFEVNTIDNTNPIINTCVADKDVILDASCNFTLPDYTRTLHYPLPSAAPMRLRKVQLQAPSSATLPQLPLQ